MTNSKESLNDCRRAFEAWNSATPADGHTVAVDSVVGKARYEGFNAAWLEKSTSRQNTQHCKEQGHYDANGYCDNPARGY